MSEKVLSYIFLQIQLTSADVFVLEVPEHPESDRASRKSHDDDADDGVHDEAGEEAEEKGDDEGEHQRDDAHLDDLWSTVLQVSHQLLEKVLRTTVAEKLTSHIGILCDNVWDAPREEVFAEKEEDMRRNLASRRKRREHEENLMREDLMRKPTSHQGTLRHSACRLLHR